MDNILVRDVREATVHKTYVHVALLYVQECLTFTFTPDEDWYPIVSEILIN